MEIGVKILDQDNWKQIAEGLHSIVFDKKRDHKIDRADGCFLIYDKNTNCSVGYVSYFETDAKSIYWQWGGLFPEFRGTNIAYKAINICLEVADKIYDTINMMVHRDNIKMLKIAFSVGFRINGVRCFRDDDIYCELSREKK